MDGFQIEIEPWIEKKRQEEYKQELTGRKCQESCGLPSFEETLIIECVAVVGSKALSVKAP